MERNLIRVPISLEILDGLVKTGASMRINCIEGVPEDAVLVSVYFDGSRQTCFLVYEHPSFRKRVYSNEKILELWPTLEFEVIEN